MDEPLNNIILRYYFTKKNKSAVTRFYNLFNELTQFIIYPQKIIYGQDKRTTIVVKNIEPLITKEIIKQWVSPFGEIDFIFVQREPKPPLCYINLINYKDIVKIVNGLKNLIETLKLQIEYSKIQGKQDLIRTFIKK